MRKWLSALIEPRRALGFLSMPRYLADWQHYKKLSGSENIHWFESHPCLSDWTNCTPYDPHYFLQTCWASRKLAKLSPDFHVEIGSSIMMVGAVSAWIPTVFVDYRPLKYVSHGLHSVAGDLLNLPFSDCSVSSLSCLHVIEHVGLGRYGDQLDPEGSQKAAIELSRILAPGGRMLISVPVGRERIEFNAHRIFNPLTILGMFTNLTLIEFSIVDDYGQLRTNISPTRASHWEYACGMFEFSS